MRITPTMRVAEADTALLCIVFILVEHNTTPMSELQMAGSHEGGTQGVRSGLRVSETSLLEGAHLS